MATIPGGVISQFGDGINEQDRLFISEILSDLGVNDGAQFFRVLNATELLSGADRFALLRAGVDGAIGADNENFIIGNSGDNIMYGGAGADTIFSVNGDDVVYGGTERDVIYGGAGDDRLFSDGGDDQVYGNAGNDFIDRDNGDDSLFGGQGDDTIEAGAGDVVFGNKGIDLILGDGAGSVLYGNEDNDVIIAGNGEDTVYGGQGDDVILMGTLSGFVYGNTGNDTIYGGEENTDTIYYLRAGQGQDVIFNFEIGQDIIVLGRDALPEGASQITDIKIETIAGRVNLQLAGTGSIELDGVEEADVLEQIEDILQLV